MNRFQLLKNYKEKVHSEEERNQINLDNETNQEEKNLLKDFIGPIDNKENQNRIIRLIETL
jgi:hypothetical protein